MLVIVGFPKSGTTTIHEALKRAGLKCVHWKRGEAPVGELVYRGWFETGDPFAFLSVCDALTQMDYCVPPRNYWPNLDIALLLAMRRTHPGTKFVLNYRDPQATAASMGRWGDLQGRMTRCAIPGLPRGVGTRQEDLVRWIDAHIRAIREVFAGSDDFLELDIASETARDDLGRFIGRELPWWGVANRNVRTGAAAD